MEKARIQEIADGAARILRLPPAIHAEGRHEITVMVGELRALAVLALEALEWRENVAEMLGKPGERPADIDVIRCHEGGGEESLVGSLGLTMIRTRSQRDRTRAMLGSLLTAADHRHTDPRGLDAAVEKAKTFVRVSDITNPV